MIGLIFLAIIFLVVTFGGKYIFAIITILTGDKDSLRDFGNLCEDDPPILNGTKYHEKHWKKPDNNWWF